MPIAPRLPMGTAEERICEYCVPLNDDTIHSPGMTDSMRAVARAIIDVVAPLRCVWTERALIGFAGYVEIVLAVDTPTSSRIELYLYNDDDMVGVAVGEGGYFNVPHDIYPRFTQGITEVVVATVRGIVLGHLEETIYSAGGSPYKWAVTVETDLGVIRVDRTNALKLLCACFKRRSKKTVTYGPY